MQCSFRIDSHAAPAEIEADSAIRSTCPRQVHPLRIPSYDYFRSGNRGIRQSKANGKIIAAARGQNPKDDFAAARCVYECLKRTVSAHGKDQSTATFYRSHCTRLKVPSTRSEDKFSGKFCGIENPLNSRL
jgi:hypothetical protein